MVVSGNVRTYVSTNGTIKPETMKTINKSVQVFHSMEKAKKYFDRMPSGYQLLTAYKGQKNFEAYFVATIEEDLPGAWPALYTIEETK